MAAADEEWTIERHLLTASPESAALFQRLREVLESFGPIRITVAKTAITFKGTRRGFAGATPTAHGLSGYLDLMRALPPDPRIRRVSPYGRNLFVHHWRLDHDDDLDDTFIGWLRAGNDVGCGAHLTA